MAKKKKKKHRILVHDTRKYLNRTDFVSAWNEGGMQRGEFIVQVWFGKDQPTGEPDAEWAMPAILGLSTSIAQAQAQTKPRTED